VVVVLQEGMGGELTTATTKSINWTWQEQKSLEANPAEISNSFRLRCLFIVRQIRNLNQNRVEGCRYVPLGLLFLPLGTAGKSVKKRITSISFPSRSWPTNLLTRLQQRFA
jgi:hypothetical protein